MDRFTLSEEIKECIRTGYANGKSPKEISSVLVISRKTIASFFSRDHLVVDLPPVVKRSRSIISANLELSIKRQIVVNLKLGHRRILGAINSGQIPETRRPSPSTVPRFLAKKGLQKRTLRLFSTYFGG